MHRPGHTWPGTPRPLAGTAYRCCRRTPRATTVCAAPRPAHATTSPATNARCSTRARPTARGTCRGRPTRRTAACCAATAAPSPSQRRRRATARRPSQTAARVACVCGWVWKGFTCGQRWGEWRKKAGVATRKDSWL
eukprot:358580-Chlamydomonas_euryale.AAC.3